MKTTVMSRIPLLFAILLYCAASTKYTPVQHKRFFVIRNTKLEFSGEFYFVCLSFMWQPKGKTDSTLCSDVQLTLREKEEPKRLPRGTVFVRRTDPFVALFCLLFFLSGAVFPFIRCGNFESATFLGYITDSDSWKEVHFYDRLPSYIPMHSYLDFLQLHCMYGVTFYF